MNGRVGVLVLGALSLPLMVIAALAVPIADDFMLAAQIRSEGAFGYASGTYFTWSGRFLTELLTGLVLPNVDVVPLVAVCNAAAFVALAVLLVAGAGAARVPAACCVLVLVYFVGLRPFLAETVFWATGGLNYAVPVAIGTGWLVALQRALARPSSWRWAPLWLPASVLVGTAHEQVGAGIVAGGIVLLGVRVWETRRVPVVPAIAVAAGFVGALVMVAAPGAQVRAQYGSHSFALNLPAMLEVLHWSALRYMTVGTLALVAGPALAFTSPWRGRPAWILALAAASLAAIAPLLAVPDFAQPRTSYAVSIWGGAAVACASWWFFTRRPVRPVYGAVVVALFLGFYLRFAADAIGSAWDIRGPVLERQALLAASRGESVSVPIIGTGDDAQRLEASADFWVNSYVAMYYGLAGVSLTPQPVALAGR